ncbi:pentapeptide repeat-containing protein [Spiractinospora alimapuensis]|uniref:pentapeptide repeat-containing protein n=1 Tax=Spiractinospora alimapuensis TaxID=2820884 RepID=UPI001F249E22|nr:pentapeptide repeat-containing protein [Spiractinospora alimapuensis]QVQ51290.1 pentapeptide repeat-containing protein [Spiractinospora alimapuensis]
MAGLVWLILGTPGIQQVPDELSPRALDAIATRAFAIVAGLGGVALLVISYRRQLTTEAAEKRAEEAADREVTKLFNERFTAAYSDLGSEHAAVRLGAVYSLAHLADDAPTDDLTQTVIDVLCAYIRMPYTPAPDPLPKNASKAQREDHRRQELDFASFREVRHTIIRIIGDRLRKETRWRAKDYDFTGATFDRCDVHGAHFTGGTVSFRDAVFAGSVDFSGVTFSGGVVSFDGTVFSGGWVTFANAKFSGQEVSFEDAKFSTESVSFDSTVFLGEGVYFSNAVFSGRGVYFNDAEFSSGAVYFGDAAFSSAVVSFGGAMFSGGGVYFHDVVFSSEFLSFNHAVFSGADANFNQALFSGGRVSFDSAVFTGGAVNFHDAMFSGGAVTFGGAVFSGGAVNFIDPEDPFSCAHGACPDGLLDGMRAGTPGVVTLPAAWQENASKSDSSTEGTSEDAS